MQSNINVKSQAVLFGFFYAAIPALRFKLSCQQLFLLHSKRASFGRFL